jgi:hypothetical protein
MISKILETLPEKTTVGYDIGCAFMSTIRRSSLWPLALARRLKMVVPSFHRHAHNRGCQLAFHPQYITTLGLEDFETCEHCFSLSNTLAATTRLATRFHRWQAIEQHFWF